jgi:hypothetical protein
MNNVSDELMQEIRENSISSGFPTVRESTTFTCNSNNPELYEWWSLVAKANTDRSIPFSTLKHNFGGLLGIWPSGYSAGQYEFTCDCLALGMRGAFWTFKKLVPKIVVENQNVHLKHSLGFTVVNNLKRLIGQGISPTVLKNIEAQVSHREILMFTTKENFDDL